MFAHYFGGSARSWQPLLAALGDGDALAPDLPGFGGTVPFSAPSLDAYADALVAVAGTQPWIGVGHSMGGKIALAAAALRPPSLLGLVLVASSPPTPEPMTNEARQASLDAYGSRAIARQQLRETSQRLSPELQAQCIEDELRVAESAWRWWLETGSRDDISARTLGLELPVLVITGDDDDVMAPEVSHGIASGLRDARLCVVADAGHLIPLECPTAVAALIRNFVDTVGAAA